jgi:hypothetical protein
MPRNTPLTETTYTGLSDTASGFTGPSTLDGSVVIGSPLQLAGVDGTNTPSDQQSDFSTYDFIDAQNPEQSLNLAGQSDPPFESARWSDPNEGNANPPGPNAAGAFSMLGKFGSAFSTLVGNHPETVSGQTGGVATAKPAIKSHHNATGSQTVILLAVVVGLFLLLAKSGHSVGPQL